MNRGKRGDAVFQAKDDCNCFIDIMHEAIDLFSIRISAYCLMTNHEEFSHMFKEVFFERQRHIEVPESKLLAPSLNAIIKTLCDLYDIDQPKLRLAKHGGIH